MSFISFPAAVGIPKSFILTNSYWENSTFKLFGTLSAAGNYFKFM